MRTLLRDMDYVEPRYSLIVYIGLYISPDVSGLLILPAIAIPPLVSANAIR